MSELLIIGFKQPHRASQVLNELRQRDWDWVADLNHAVVIRHDEENRLRVDLSIDPRMSEDVAWARLWGKLLNVILAEAVNQGIVEAAGGLTNINSREGEATLGVNWWIEEIGLSPQFISGAGAIIEPGDSALLLLLRTDDPIAVLKKLRDYGGTLLRTSLSGEQDTKLNDAIRAR
jgi:uncharacterized membrane protein